MPLFREIGASDAALLAQPGAEALPPDARPAAPPRPPGGDPKVAALPGELGTGGLLDLAGPPLHQPAPASVLTDLFARLAELCAARGLGLGVEIALWSGRRSARPGRWRRPAGRPPASASCSTGVSAHALRLADPASLGAGLVKLDWMPGLPTRPAAEQQELGAALARIGTERVVLAGADLDSGAGQPARRPAPSQGRQVDAGASRPAASPLLALPPRGRTAAPALLEWPAARRRRPRRLRQPRPARCRGAAWSWPPALALAGQPRCCRTAGPPWEDGRRLAVLVRDRTASGVGRRLLLLRPAWPRSAPTHHLQLARQCCRHSRRPAARLQTFVLPNHDVAVAWRETPALQDSLDALALLFADDPAFGPDPLALAVRLALPDDAALLLRSVADSLVPRLAPPRRCAARATRSTRRRWPGSKAPWCRPT